MVTVHSVNCLRWSHVQFKNQSLVVCIFAQNRNFMILSWIMIIISIVSGYGVSNSLRWKDLTDNSASYIVTVMIMGYFCPLTVIMYCYRSIYNLVQVFIFSSAHSMQE